MRFTARYRVTDAGGPVTQVAGQKVRPGDVVELDLEQARFERSRGLIEPIRAKPAAPKSKRRRAA